MRFSMLVPLFLDFYRVVRAHIRALVWGHVVDLGIALFICTAASCFQTPTQLPLPSRSFRLSDYICSLLLRLSR